MDTEVEEARLEQVSIDISETIMSRLNRLELVQPDIDPEQAANAMLAYQQGLADAIVIAAPEVLPQLGRRVEGGLCSPQARPSQLVSLSRLVQALPDLASGEGFDCVVKRGKEDIALWSALDAWKASDVPATQAIQRLAANAADERTRSRFAVPAAEPPGT